VGVAYSHRECIYIYIYIYVCVCVCVCTRVSGKRKSSYRYCRASLTASNCYRTEWRGDAWHGMHNGHQEATRASTAPIYLSTTRNLQCRITSLCLCPIYIDGCMVQLDRDPELNLATACLTFIRPIFSTETACILQYYLLFFRLVLLMA